METRDAAIVALADAVQFETEGREFYLQAAGRARNPLAKAVFQALADDEQDHVRRVREIHGQLKDQAGWPHAAPAAARVEGAGVFAATGGEPAAPDADAQAALAVAAEMEERGLAFYRERLERACCDAEAEFYRGLVAEEEGHLRAIRSVQQQWRG